MATIIYSYFMQALEITIVVVVIQSHIYTLYNPMNTVVTGIMMGKKKILHLFIEI